jgi:2-keto-4-pentenoate hydratase
MDMTSLESFDERQSQLSQSAQSLFDAYRTQTAVAAPRLVLGDDLAGAYAVQALNTARWISAGRRISGYKVGLTARAAQAQFGTDRPTLGALFADMEIPSGDTIAADRLFAPRAEGEIAFVIGKDLTQESPTLAEILRATEFVLPAIEIVDTRIATWDVKLVDAVADNGCTGLYVLGASPKKVSSLDLRLCGMALEVNGEPLSTGAGLACLGHPANALRWAAAERVRQGQPLKVGDVVLSGALGPMVPIHPGDHVDVRISGLGSCQFFLGEKP